MKGQYLQDLMANEGYSVNKMAQLIGKSQQVLASALKHDDIRTGLLEDIARAMNRPLSFFYGEAFGLVQSVGDNNTQVTQVAGNYSNAPDSNILEILKMKDEQLLLTIRQVSKAQEQMDRVLDRFGGATSSEDPEGM